ncbi:hypothetical protein DMN91_004058 [Ooceraea biroi]|uniref:Transposable element Tc3 transposase n=1 Tax=Ooceraea biroi TaxID=2015173 RepID=A0A3L8DTS6_OOCBI|nr:hypothetical protein DMN91_004058 [Ooceraea biroi]
MVEQTLQFFHTVCFSDEATFKSNGCVNRHNMHYWSRENPHWRQIDNQRVWSINVWCGILNGHIIGPHFFDGTLNGATYYNFLENHLSLLIEDVDLHTRGQMWFQQDGAPAHSIRALQILLNQKYPHRWIGRKGSVAWPPRSPDLTLLDYFLWGYVKSIVYSEPPTTRDNMIVRITEALENISSEVLRRVDHLTHRIHLCRRVQGQNFEYLL